MVLIRAMSLRSPRIFFKLSVCPMLSWNFSLNSWSARSRSWCRSSSLVKLRILSAFIKSILSVLVRTFALHEPRAQRKLVRGQPHGFLGIGYAHAFHLEQDLARTDNGNPVIWRALAFTHTGFSGLLGDRLVGKQANPNLAATLYETRDSHAARLDLAVADPARLQYLQAKLPKGQLRTAPRLTGHASALLLAVLHFLWHQHNEFSVPSSQFPVRTRRRPAAPRASSARGFRRGKSSTSRQSPHRWYALR